MEDACQDGRGQSIVSEPSSCQVTPPVSSRSVKPGLSPSSRSDRYGQSRTFLQALHPDVPWPACAGINVARHSEICKGLCSSGTIQAVGFAMNSKSFDSGICWQSLVVPAFKEWGFRTLKKLTLVHFRAFWVLLGGEKLPEGNYALTTRTSQARIHMFGSSGS